MKNTNLENLAGVIRPIARLFMGRGAKFTDFESMSKRAFIECAREDFALEGKRVTDSRVAVLSGIQRRDIKKFEGKVEAGTSPLQRVHAKLLTHAGGDITRAEFDEIVRAASQAEHPRTLLDEFERLGLVEVNEDIIHVINAAYLGQDDGEKLTIASDNLKAHLDTVVSNLEGKAPQLEQAVFAKGLHPDDAIALERQMREKVGILLRDLHESAKAFKVDRQGAREVRFGVYWNEGTRDD